MDDDFLSLTCPSIQIPDSWTPELACEIADFLGDIISAIWVAHGSDMAQYLEHTLPPALRATSLDDDSPF